MPILSRAAIKSRFEGLLVDSPCDNVLLEYRLALELSCRGLVERVYPLFRGDSDPSTGAVGNYFRQGCHPNIPPLSSQSSAGAFAIFIAFLFIAIVLALNITVAHI